jgi:hypothetical protein
MKSTTLRSIDDIMRDMNDLAKAQGRYLGKAFWEIPPQPGAILDVPETAESRERWLGCAPGDSRDRRQRIAHLCRRKKSRRKQEKPCNRMHRRPKRDRGKPRNVPKIHEENGSCHLPHLLPARLAGTEAAGQLMLVAFRGAAKGFVPPSSRRYAVRVRLPRKRGVNL